MLKQYTHTPTHTYTHAYIVYIYITQISPGKNYTIDSVNAILIIIPYAYDVVRLRYDNRRSTSE